MKVLLLNAPPMKTMGVVGFMYPPLGILYLASYAREKLAGLEIKVIDGYQESFEKIPGMITDFKPDVIGVSFTTQASTGAYEIIKRVKTSLPETLIVSGGPHPTLLSSEVLENSMTDIVVVGEGEETFLEILKAFKESKDLDNIAGTIVKSNGLIKINAIRPLIKDLDTIPFPARDLLDMRRYPGYHYKKRKRDTSLVSGRGCPFDCVFCSNPVWKNQKPWFRLRSPQNIADEIEHLMNDFGIYEFYDETDEFNGNLSWAKAVCDELIKRKLDISWKAQMRADNVDVELARKMVQAGCWLGFFGVESGNDRTLEGIGKKLTVADIKRSLHTLKQANMKTFALLMAFNVWEQDGKLCYETKQDTLNTLNFAKEMVREKMVDLISWSLTTPFPGSKLYDIALKYKLIPQERIGRWELWDPSSNFVMELPGITNQDWIDIQTEGKKLQARLLIKSGTFNIHSIPLYAKKAFSLIKNKMGLSNQNSHRN
ncbi:MAG: B12-binding domain-containing radical SAM protein [Desulfuromonadales bacterium]|nr:B12-binding domain-containing radical SAM protein [Desulfuromonadales bacterium]